MNIKTLNEISSIVKQKTEGLYDVSEWDIFIKQVYITRQRLIYVSFIKNNNDTAQVVRVCIVGGNLLLEDNIVITDINKDGCYDFYEEISTASGIDKCTLKVFL